MLFLLLTVGHNFYLFISIPVTFARYTMYAHGMQAVICRGMDRKWKRDRNKNCHSLINETRFFSVFNAACASCREKREIKINKSTKTKYLIIFILLWLSFFDVEELNEINKENRERKEIRWVRINCCEESFRWKMSRRRPRPLLLSWWWWWWW